jgi:hypothetical protein
MMMGMGMEAAALATDERMERMDRVAVLYAEITAASREFLRVLAECNRLADWAEEGFASCADWLAWRVGITRHTATEKVRVARALESLPQISEAMATGELSFNKVRALTRVASQESEAELLAFARVESAASVERLVAGWKTLDRAGEDSAERRRHRLRRLSIFPDGDGMYVVRGLVTPEVAAVLMKAIDAAGDALFAATAKEDRPEPPQRRADALGLVAERALAAGLGGEDAPVSGSRAERYQVMLHVEPAPLSETGEPGMCEVADGTRVPAGTARRISCDASVVEVTTADNSVIDVGRRVRVVSAALRRALDVRDRGCRFPGCGLRYTDAHHIVHWADSGETSLDNTLLLCRHHHRYVHEGGWRVATDTEGQAVFFSPHGKALVGAPPMPLTDADALLRRNRERGVEPDWRTGLPPAA